MPQIEEITIVTTINTLAHDMLVKVLGRVYAMIIKDVCKLPIRWMLWENNKNEKQILQLQMVCKEWVTLMKDNISYFSDILLVACDGSCEKALVCACKLGHYEVVFHMLQSASASADCMDGDALVLAASSGQIAIVRLLLEWSENAPKANCQDGNALVSASEGGHEAIVRLLLEHKNAPRADCQNGKALIDAAFCGKEVIVRLLLDWKVNAPHGDCCRSALICAAGQGHDVIVQLLLGRPENAPCTVQGARPGWPTALESALSEAIEFGHESIVRMLLRHDIIQTQYEDILVIAAMKGRESIVRIFLENAPLANCQNGEVSSWAS